MNFPLRHRVNHGFLVCLSVVSMAISTMPALGKSLQSDDAQPLTCSIQKQQLICNLPPRSYVTSGDRSAPKPLSPVAQPSALFSPSLDKTLASILLAISFIGFPIGLTVAMVWYDKHSAKQQAKWQTQVETLERIWHQSL
jgi:hypothetical protein